MTIADRVADLLDRAPQIRRHHAEARPTSRNFVVIEAEAVRLMPFARGLSLMCLRHCFCHFALLLFYVQHLHHCLWLL